MKQQRFRIIKLQQKSMMHQKLSMSWLAAIRKESV